MEPTATAEKLYSPSQIGLASFLGSPAAACWFISRNEKWLGRPGARWLWLGGAATIALLALSYFLPDKFPHLVIPLAYSFGIRAFVSRQYAHPLAEHLVNGGQLGSWWSVVGISLLVLIIIVALIFGILMLLPESILDTSSDSD